MTRNGLVHVYTGNGKGKTTAAIGLAARARGHGMRVAYLHFHKDPARWGYGELKILRKIGVDIFAFANRHPHFYKDVDMSDVRRECLEGLKRFRSICGKNKHDMVILDEINISVRDGFLKRAEILEAIRRKPAAMELVLTGRGADKEVMRSSDLVSRINKVKHYHDSGVQRRKGIEY